MYNYDYLCHYGVKGMKWGVRRYQNPDGSLKSAGRQRYSQDSKSNENQNKKGLTDKQKKVIKTVAVVGAAAVGVALVAYGGRTAAQYFASNKMARKNIENYIKKQSDLSKSLNLGSIKRPNENLIKSDIKKETSRIFEAKRRKADPFTYNLPGPKSPFEHWEKTGASSLGNASKAIKKEGTITKARNVIKPIVEKQKGNVNLVFGESDPITFKDVRKRLDEISYIAEKMSADPDFSKVGDDFVNEILNKNKKALGM